MGEPWHPRHPQGRHPCTSGASPSFGCKSILLYGPWRACKICVSLCWLCHNEEILSHEDNKVTIFCHRLYSNPTPGYKPLSRVSQVNFSYFLLAVTHRLALGQSPALCSDLTFEYRIWSPLYNQWVNWICIIYVYLGILTYVLIRTTCFSIKACNMYLKS